MDVRGEHEHGDVIVPGPGGELSHSTELAYSVNPDRGTIASPDYRSFSYSPIQWTFSSPRRHWM
jgi:hypothetical protein